jgi:outer membrane receptor protein involved in Fe transport
MRSTFTGAAGAYRFTLLAGAAMAVALPGAAYAQDQADDADLPEESTNVIIVTANKREQTLQEVPIAVSVTTGETIERAQIRDVLDLQSVVPSLRVSQLQTSSATTFIIRGFGNGDNNFGIEPSVGVFIDGVFRSRSAAAISDLNLIQRVEVLNGPQSTLFGKNASAGVISIVTKEPQYEFGGQIEAAYGNFNALNLRGEVTGPITDNIAWSLDGTYQRRDGFGRIVNLNNADINDRNRWSLRGNLLIEPSADVKIRLIADYTDIDESCCQTSNLVVGGITQLAIGGVGGQFPTDFFSFDNFLNAVPFNKNENYGFSGQLDWAFGNVSLTSITAYRELTNAFTQDVDFTTADITAETRDQAVDTFTQELRLTSDFDGPINFLLGGYYFKEDISQDSSLSLGRDFRNFAAIQASAPLVPANATPAQRIAVGNAVLNNAELGLGLPLGSILGGTALTRERFTMDNTSWSVFGTVDFEPVDGLVFTAGFNYTDDRKDFVINFDALDPLANINLVDAGIRLGSGGTVTNRAQFQALPAAVQQQLLAGATNPAVNQLLGLSALQFQTPSPDVPNSVEPGRTQDDQLTYLLRVAYQVSNELNIYASYSTGFKASSVNLSRDSRPLSTDYIPGPGPRGSTFAAPASPIINAGLATPNLSTGTRFAGPEEAMVYEIGMKGQWDGWGFNLAIFDQTIEGFQSFLFTGLGFGLANAGKQSVRGFELDTTVQPTDGLVLTFAATHLDPLYDDFRGGPLGDLSGRRPAGIPAWSLRTSATYSHEFGDSGNMLITRVDYQHDSKVNILDGIAGFNANQFTREINLVNASMNLELNNGLAVGLFARNLLDEQFPLTIFPGVAQAGTVSGYPNPPRTWGGLVRYKF